MHLRVCQQRQIKWYKGTIGIITISLVLKNNVSTSISQMRFKPGLFDLNQLIKNIDLNHDLSFKNF